FQIIMSTIDEADCLVSSMIIKEQDSTTDSMPDPEPGPEPISDPVRTFAMPAHLGEQDVISSLPDNCLFTIFSCFDRDTLEVMETVSQKMLCITRDRGYVKRRKPLKQLVVFKEGNKFTFYAIPIDKSKWLVFETTGNGDGIRRKIEPLDEEYYSHVPNPDPEFLEIPAEMFAAIAQLSLKYAPVHVNLSEVRVDAVLLRRLKDAFHGKLPARLDLSCICADKDAGLIDFVLDSKITSLFVSWAISPVNFESRLTIFDEEFVTKFSAREEERLELYVDLDVFGRSWFPTPQFLPILCRYTNLKLEGVNLNLDLLKKLIDIAFSTLRLKYAVWTFAVNAPLAVGLMAILAGNRELFSLTKKSTRDEYLIRKKDSSYRCILSEETIGPMMSITITFTKNGVSKKRGSAK
ncbi:hypothetical protein PRIPAC_70924, partial [Pristionchus pacificus]